MSFGADKKLRMRIAPVVALALLLPALASAQHAGHGTVSPSPMRTEKSERMPMLEMSDNEMSSGLLGDYEMTREASGTSWQPEATPMSGVHYMLGDWNVMTHGFVNAIYSDSDAPRGETDRYVQSMLMAMAHREAGPGMLGLRAMVSLDPWLVGDTGYSLLFQTGETADGQTPLIDRQHPHDLFMELAATYSIPVGEKQSVFFYGGLPGEPALGPPAYMHRLSGMDNPEAPIGHHWLDATHITFGVVTAGYVWDRIKVEGSAFNGREPDQNRTNIDTGPLTSWSTRLTYNPTEHWSMQVSYGDIKSPEQLDPEMDMKRSTASVSYHHPMRGAEMETTVAFGRNEMSEGPTTDAYLLDTAIVIADRHTLFGRFERVDKDELFEDGDPLAGQVFTINKVSLGAIHDFLKTEGGKFGIGAEYSRHFIPDTLEPVYGNQPDAWLVFARWRM